MPDPTQKINIEAVQQATRNNNWVKEVTNQLQGQKPINKIIIDPVKVEKQKKLENELNVGIRMPANGQTSESQRAQTLARSTSNNIPQFANRDEEKKWVDKNAIKEQSDKTLKGASKLLKSTFEILGWGKKDSNSGTGTGRS